MKKYQSVQDTCTASISVKRNKVKTYGNNVYLRNGQEFEIQLSNFTQDVVLAKISMNGKEISSSGIVLKPGQNIFLERFLDDNKKFLFETYKVNNTEAAQTATAKNGDISVTFFKEKQNYSYILTSNTFTMPSVYYNNSGTSVNSSYSNLTNTSSFAGPNTRGVKSILPKSEITLDSIETGRVEKGSSSNQDFTNYSGDFEHYSFKTAFIKILPFSTKPLEAKDLAIYCVECGTKNRKSNYKFCPRCGTKF